MRNRMIAAAVAFGIALAGGAALAAPATAAPASAATSNGKAWGNFFKGRTDLTLDPAAAAALTSLGVKVKPVFAGRTGSAISFAIVGDPSDGTIEHVGGLVLQAGHTRLYLTNYTIDLNSGVLSGLVNFRQRADLFTIGAATPQGVTLALTPGAASVLNTTFGVTAFTAGLVIGYGNPVLR
ncbi:hypothetical protein SK571_15245 [Lentzea sp. BCCO 10_0798]|uniref:Htaa protein n=1 Tax=Lentzea kristufekii TaxID=3095430 RepID=A0ABU4TRR4_9PSEU|nr:hypothetical protein [Lentzea sp. BCCO 10_0798]MDX8050744.1 hypothetical protein [Lentzea sp. BCCO 10_0798]